MKQCNRTINFQRMFVLIFVGLLIVSISCKKDDDKSPEIQTMPEPEMVSGDVLEDKTLAITNIHGNNFYLINGRTTVNANLKIEPGVVLIFKKEADLYIANGGTIQAEGTESAKVTFKGEVETKGYWGGIFIDNDNELNKLIHCNIEFAGNKDRSAQAKSAAVIVYNKARLIMKHSRVFQSGGYGMYIFEEAQLPEFTNNTITESSSAVAMIGLQALGFVNGSNDFTGNTKDHIDTYNAQNYLNGSHTWHAVNVPYRLPGKRIDIEGALIIEPGAQFLGTPNAGIKIHQNGILNAKGTSAKPIIFKGQEETPGYWSGFQIANGMANSLVNVMISNAGGANSFSGSDRRASIEVTAEGNATITNCSVANGVGPSIRVLSGGKLSQSGNILDGGLEE